MTEKSVAHKKYLLDRKNAMISIKENSTKEQKKKLKHGKCACGSGKKFFKCCWHADKVKI